MANSWKCVLDENGGSVDDITCDDKNDQGLAASSDGGSASVRSATGHNGSADSIVWDEATTFGSSADLSASCSTEKAACEDDTTCASFATMSEMTRAAYRTCLNELPSDGAERSTAHCVSITVRICCLSDSSGYDLLNNDRFVEYWQCALEDLGCSGDEITCTDDGMTDTDDNGMLGRKAVALLPPSDKR